MRKDDGRQRAPLRLRGKWNPAEWASLSPNGLGHTKPNHYLDMLRVLRDNAGQLGYAWRIVRDGVCDGCALGTAGLRDHTLDGIHLCMTRLNLLRLNTMPALDPGTLADVSPLTGMSGAALQKLGRLPYPMVRGRGERGFRRVSWDEALALVGQALRQADPTRIGLYTTARGLTNEAYYLAAKAARFLGTNNVDNAARICHAPSTVALKEALGVAASTCSYSDWIGTDLLVLFGSDMPNNQPVTTKYMYYAKKAGTRIVVVNPYREPGLERYWIPSVLESALFGTRLADDFFLVQGGGDIAFINGVLKSLIEAGQVDEAFIERHTAGFADLAGALAAQPWELLEQASGLPRADMQRFAELYAAARSAVFVWSMGLTQHRFGVDNVAAVINLALARGMVGRAKCGLMPIRGHSGVQGAAECGAAPWSFPGGVPVDAAHARRFAELWGFPVPDRRGLTAVQMVEAARRGEMDVLYSVGGNFLDTLPEPEFVREALARVPVRVHQDIVLNTSALVPAAEAVVLLPAATRYESPGGGTQTTTERRILFSPEIPGRRIGEARPEWQILMQVAEAAYPERRAQIHFPAAQAVRDEMARAIPFYDGIQHLREKGDSLQWGGPRLCEGGAFEKPDGRARFRPVAPPELTIPPGHFLLSTRRGKQFNSMVFGRLDPLTGAGREDVLIAREDADRLNLEDGDRVVLCSPVGTLHGTIRIAPIKPRNLQVHWPEGNVLIRRGACDPVCGIPDYNALVTIEREIEGKTKREIEGQTGPQSEGETDREIKGETDRETPASGTARRAAGDV